VLSGSRVLRGVPDIPSPDLGRHPCGVLAEDRLLTPAASLSADVPSTWCRTHGQGNAPVFNIQSARSLESDGHPPVTPKFLGVPVTYGVYAGAATANGLVSKSRVRQASARTQLKRSAAGKRPSVTGKKTPSRAVQLANRRLLLAKRRLLRKLETRDRSSLHRSAARLRRSMTAPIMVS